MKRILVLFVLVCVAFPLHAAAEDTLPAALEQAKALEAEERHDEVIALLEPYADRDDADVLWRLALASLSRATDGVAPDAITPGSIRPAIDYARRAGELGRAEGWNLLWVIHSNGMGGPVDAEGAAAYLRAAAEGGDDAARFNLMISLYEGTQFFERNVDEACGLYELLADSEDIGAHVGYYRGWMLIRGECGLDVDRQAGLALIQQAAEAEMVAAQRTMAAALEEGWSGEPDPAAALAWTRRAAAHGDPYSQWQLGRAHAEGRGVERDDAKAIALFESAAEARLPSAYTSLAVMHASGAGVKQDFVQARAMYERAVALGETHALRNLAVMHALGQGIPPDPVQGRVYYLQHLHHGHERDPGVEAIIDRVLDEAGRAEAEERFADWVSLQAIMENQ